MPGEINYNENDMLSQKHVKSTRRLKVKDKPEDGFLKRAILFIFAETSQLKFQNALISKLVLLNVKHRHQFIILKRLKRYCYCQVSII